MNLVLPQPDNNKQQKKTIHKDLSLILTKYDQKEFRNYKNNYVLQAGRVHSRDLSLAQY